MSRLAYYGYKSDRIAVMGNVTTVFSLFQITPSPPGNDIEVLYHEYLLYWTQTLHTYKPEQIMHSRVLTASISLILVKLRGVE
jgi:hypothetical protein